MKTLNIAVVGYGNIGRFAIEAVREAPDMKLAGLVRRASSITGAATTTDARPEPAGVQITTDAASLGKVDAAILCGPSRAIPEIAPAYLQRGICTVDAFDIHGQPLWELRESLGAIAKKTGVAAVVSAGWDPGVDSMIRALMLAMAPDGNTHTNFGPGMSMGNTTCAKSKKGVRDALAMTIPLGAGTHRRVVYVELKKGAKFTTVEKAIKTDSYFAKDDTRVLEVANVEALKDVGHGVHIVRKGASSRAQNQFLEFNMKINNPALTAQIMVACARAAVTRLKPGAYTMPEIAPMDLLPGDRETLVKTLV